MEEKVQLIVKLRIVDRDLNNLQKQQEADEPEVDRLITRRYDILDRLAEFRESRPCGNCRGTGVISDADNPESKEKCNTCYGSGCMLSPVDNLKIQKGLTDS